ncbi:MAG: hypothetical protein NVS1B12_07290 [Acidimicrobiales bacterium]
MALATLGWGVAAGAALAVDPSPVAPPVPVPVPLDTTGLPVAPPAPAAASGAAAHRPGPAYWLVGGDGGVFPFGRGAFEGGMASSPTNAPVIAAAVTRSGLGYWLAAADGGVFAFGDAKWKGSLPDGKLRGTVVGIAATPDGAGYWLAGADGGVFGFGSAAYLGGLAGKPLSAPITGIAATPSGHGYWLTGTDGAVYAFGDAGYLGGVGNQQLQGPITGIAATTSGRGYWLAGTDGGVYGFGDAPYLGGLSGRPHATIVGIARTTTGGGYWLAGSDGGVFGFGEAGYFGSVSGARLNRGIVAITAGDGIAIPHSPLAPATPTGFDISWPQCGGIRPAPPYGFGVVGVTNGHMFSVNPCLAEQWSWATASGSFASVYVNSNGPTAAEWAGFAARDARGCGANAGCLLDLWGRQGARQALADAHRLPTPFWWLDVETGNEWLPDPAANAVILRGMIDELEKAGKRVGVYSTARQWAIIAGGFAPGLPTWVAGAPTDNPASFCNGHSFGGGPTWMTQGLDPSFDADVLCPAGMQSYRVAFAAPAPAIVPEYDAPTVDRPRHPSAVGQVVLALREDASAAVLATSTKAAGRPSPLEWVLFISAAGALGGAGLLGRRRMAAQGAPEPPS